MNYNRLCLVWKETPWAHVDVTFVSCDRQQPSTMIKDELTGGDNGSGAPYTPPQLVPALRKILIVNVFN